MTDKRAVVFDFDGTIADSFSIFVETVHEVLNRRSKLAYDEIETLRGLQIREIIRTLNIRTWQLPYLIYSGRKSMARKVSDVKIFDGMQKAIQTLSERGISLYIVSTGSKRAIDSFLIQHQINHYFKTTIGDVSLSGKAKCLSNLITREQLNLTNTIYIGDETRDGLAAKKVNMQCISVSWGYNSAEALYSTQPNAVVNSPAELLTTMGHLLGVKI